MLEILLLICFSACFYYVWCIYRNVGNVTVYPKCLLGLGHGVLLAKALVCCLTKQNIIMVSVGQDTLYFDILIHENPGVISPKLFYLPNSFSLMQDLGEYAVNNKGITALLFGPFPWYVIADPVNATVILNRCIEKMFLYELINPLFGDTLVSASVPVWKRNRRIIDLAFKPKVLEGYMRVFNAQASNLLELIDAKAGKGFVDVTNEIISNVLETTCQTTMGMQPNDQLYVNEKYVKALHEVFEITTMRVKKPWLFFNFIFRFCKAKRDLDENLSVIHEISATMVQLRKSEYLEPRKNRKELSAEDGGTNIQKPMPITRNGTFLSFLDVVIQNSVSEEGSIFTDLQLRYLCDNILLAAFDTTTYEILFTLVCIGSDEEVQRKILQEIEEVIGVEERVTKEHAVKLIYLEAVIKEAIRLYPIAPMVGRESSTDVHFDKVTIPAGSSIVVHLWAINRQKKYWGQDADEFNPDRWLNANTLPEHPNAFGSFSFGKRNCVGKLYAMMHMKTTLVPILRKYRISSDHKKMEFDFYVTLKAKSGHLIKFELR